MENKCPKCNSIVSENFCSNCGEAISELAVLLSTQKEKNIKLETIKDIIALTNDAQTLKMLKAYASNIINKK